MALVSVIQRPVSPDLLDISRSTKPASERDFQLWTESLVPQRRLGPSDCPGGRRSIAGRVLGCDLLGGPPASPVCAPFLRA